MIITFPLFSGNSRSLKKADYALTGEQQRCLRDSLPSFIQGLVLVPSFRTQSFALRLLKATFLNFLTRFPLTDQHPLLIGIFLSNIDSPDLEKHFLVVLKSEFLSKRRDCGPVLGFVAMALAKLASSHRRQGVLERVAKFLCEPVLELTFVAASTDERVVLKGKDLLGESEKEDRNGGALSSLD